MKKLIITLVAALLLTLATAVPAFADIDGPPPDSLGCEPSTKARNLDLIIDPPNNTGGTTTCFEHPS